MFFISAKSVSEKLPDKKNSSVRRKSSHTGWYDAIPKESTTLGLVPLDETLDSMKEIIINLGLIQSLRLNTSLYHICRVRDYP